MFTAYLSLPQQKSRLLMESRVQCPEIAGTCAKSEDQHFFHELLLHEVKIPAELQLLIRRDFDFMEQQLMKVCVSPSWGVLRCKKANKYIKQRLG